MTYICQAELSYWYKIIQNKKKFPKNLKKDCIYFDYLFPKELSHVERRLEKIMCFSAKVQLLKTQCPKMLFTGGAALWTGGKKIL